MRTPFRKVLLSVLMVLATAVSTVVLAAPAQAATYYTIKNRSSGKCLAIGSGDQSNGAKAMQWTCNGGTEQQWIYDSANRLRNRYTDKCLAIGDGAMYAGAKVIQWTCNTNDEQRWIYFENNAYYNLNSGLCLAIGSHDQSNGALAVQWTCNSQSSDQQWLFTT